MKRNESKECIPICKFCKRFTDYGDTGNLFNHEYEGIGDCSKINKVVDVNCSCKDGFECIY